MAVPLLSGPPVSRHSAVPLHAQCRARIHELIEHGELAPGTKLPPERELALAWGISLAPVRQAILDLVSDGLLTRVRGSGTYVRAGKVEKKLSILSSFTASLHATGAPAEVRLLSCERAPAPADVRERGARGERAHPAAGGGARPARRRAGRARDRLPRAGVRARGDGTAARGPRAGRAAGARGRRAGASRLGDRGRARERGGGRAARPGTGRPGPRGGRDDLRRQRPTRGVHAGALPR